MVPTPNIEYIPMYIVSVYVRKRNVNPMNTVVEYCNLTIIPNKLADYESFVCNVSILK